MRRSITVITVLSATLLTAPSLEMLGALAEGSKPSFVMSATLYPALVQNGDLCDVEGRPSRRDIRTFAPA